MQQKCMKVFFLAFPLLEQFSFKGYKKKLQFGRELMVGLGMAT
jgi:hypothetical protein